MDNLIALENWLDPLINGLSHSEKNKLFKSLGGSLRKRQSDRIKSQGNPDGSQFAPRQKRITKNTQVKSKKAMFLKLRQARHLKIKTTAEGVAVGFSGRAARIAEIHQGGLLARVMPGGSLFQYPARKLLGFSRDDRDYILEKLQQHLNL